MMETRADRIRRAWAAYSEAVKPAQAAFDEAVKPARAKRPAARADSIE